MSPPRDHVWDGRLPDRHVCMMQVLTYHLVTDPGHNRPFMA